MAESPLPKLLLVDNEPQVLDTITFILADLYTVEGFTSGRQAIEAVQKQVYPVAIVDLRMEEMSGIEVLVEIKAASPFTQVIILTGYVCADSAISALNQNAYRYLLKPFGRSIFLDTIAGAMKAYEAALLAHERLNLEPSRLEHLGLSPRLAEVAGGILEGKSNGEIAKDLAIAPRTVEKHVERLLAHFQISSRFLLESEVIKTLRQLARRGASIFLCLPTLPGMEIFKESI
jgi:two-component system response regulator FixJ